MYISGKPRNWIRSFILLHYELCNKYRIFKEHVKTLHKESFLTSKWTFLQTAQSADRGWYIWERVQSHVKLDKNHTTGRPGEGICNRLMIRAQLVGVQFISKKFYTKHCELICLTQDVLSKAHGLLQRKCCSNP